MTQPHENETASPAMLRAEQVVNEVGERFGMWAGSVMTRMQRAAGALNQEANRVDTPGAEAEQGQDTQTTPSMTQRAAKQGQDTHAMQRAEELVGKAGEYATRWTLTGNMNLRRAMARLREDMEDMWVEAHEIEHHLHEKPHQEPPSEQAH